MNDAMNDEERLAKRQELKAGIAQRDVQKRQLSSLRKMVAEINARSDEAANIHRDECLPLQDELGTLNANQAVAILANEHSDPEDDARRLEILTQIESANMTLEATTKLNENLVDSIQTQSAALGSVVSKTVALESQLARLGSAALLEQDTLLRSRIEWAGLRVQNATASMENYQANLTAARRTRPRAVRGYSILVEAARRELKDSEQQAAAAQDEQAELRKQMLDE